MWNFWRGFQLIFVAGIVSGNSENSTFTQNLFALVNKISEDYFQVFKCLTYTTDESSYLDYLELRVPVIFINLSDLGEYLGRLLTESFEQGCGGHIIHTTPDNRFLLARKLVEAKSRAERYRYNRERYVFLPKGTNDTNLEMLRHPDLYFLPNSILVTPDPGSNPPEFVINGHTTFKADSPEFYEVLDTWSEADGFRRNADLFPDKLKDTRGKKMVFGLMQYVPYSLILEEPEGITYDGLDVRLADLFAKVVNGKWTAIDHPIHLWGTKFPNGSGNGIFGSVQDHIVDLGYGGFYQWYCDIIDCTYPYIQSEVTCLVPRPQILSGWMTIVLPFTASSWIGLSVAFFVGLIFVFGLIVAEKHLNEIKISGVMSTAFRALYTIFRLQIQQIPKVAYTTSPLATYIKISTLYYFFVAVFWQGGIASILTVPRYESPINSPTDLVSKWPKVEWGAVHGAWVNSIKNSSDPVLSTIVKKFVVLDGESLKKRTRTRDFGFLIERLPNGHYGFNDYIDEEAVQFLRLMDHGIYTAFGTIILPKGSPYTEKLDNLIHWMYSTGIIQKMELQVYLDRINNHLQSLIRHSNERETVKVILGIRHIEGPIYIFFVGVLLSLLAFIGEKLSFKYGKQKR